LSDKSKMEQFSIAAQKGTKEKFNIHNHAAEIIGLYEKLKAEQN